MLTSEMHDPYARTTGTWKYENTKTPSKGGSGVEPAKYPPKVKSENVFYNSRVLERN